MTLRLRKLKPTLWLGNGFGHSAAEWTLADHPGWTIAKNYLADWEAAHVGGRRITAWSRKELLEKLAPIVEEMAAPAGIEPATSGFGNQRS